MTKKKNFLLRAGLSLVVALVLIASAFAGAGTFFGVSAANADTPVKKLNVYVIAGQSNAAGYSLENKVSAANKKPAYSSGIGGVYYYGRGDSNFINGSKVTVKFGQGIGIGMFGAEVGMADVIAENGGTEALIIKYAYGGTYLTNNVTNEAFSKAYGNWCPPSKRVGKTDKTNDGKIIEGKLYDEWKTTVGNALALYEGLGYDCDYKGLFWMQGEAESDGTYASADYEGHLTALIGDMRDDLATLFGTSKQNETRTAPFVIGKIAPTFAGGGAGVNAVRLIQDRVAAANEYVYCVETDDYIIVDPSTDQPNAGSPDRYHFSGDDMISLGKAVATTMLAQSAPCVSVKCVGGGKANVGEVELDGNPIAVTFTPNKNHHLKSVTYDGADVTANLTDGVYTVVDTTGRHVLKATFEENKKYSLTYDYDRTAGTLKATSIKTYYAGEKVVINVTVNDGCALESVSFNGEPLQPIAANRYSVTIVDGENVLKAVFNNPNVPAGDESGEIGAGDSSAETAPKDEGGCAGAVKYIGAFTVMLGAAYLILRP